METDILFELLLHIDTLKYMEKRNNNSPEKLEKYDACTNLIVSFYNRREKIEATYGNMRGRKNNDN